MKRMVLFFAVATASAVFANVRSVKMLPGEKWWGVCNSFGRDMPFSEKSDFSCDLRLNNYSHQSLSFLCSDKGRTIWCKEPVGVAIKGGKITFEAAFKTMIDYRASVEADNVCAWAWFADVEENHAGWPHKTQKYRQQSAKQRLAEHLARKGTCGDPLGVEIPEGLCADF